MAFWHRKAAGLTALPAYYYEGRGIYRRVIEIVNFFEA
jgi:hypothetical protein